MLRGTRGVLRKKAEWGKKWGPSQIPQVSAPRQDNYGRGQGGGGLYYLQV